MIKYIAFTYIVLLLFSIDLTAQQTINGTISHDQIDRTYILYLPENYSENNNYPLLLNFHGYGSNAFDQMWYGDFRPIADTAGFIIVHPQGTQDTTGTTHFNVGGWTSGSTVDDVGFTSALLDSLIEVYSIDESRIYSTGMSNGGYMSFRLACELSDRITAVASVTGSMTPSVYDSCNPQHPTPVMQMHGLQDAVVSYSGSLWSLGIEDVLTYWADVNNCISGPTSEILPDIDMTDGSTAERITYTQGEWNADVIHFRIDGAGHSWPGNFLGSNNTNYDIVGAVEIWNFLSQYDLNTLSTVVSIEEHNENISEWYIEIDEASSLMRILNLNSENADYTIVSLEGKIISAGFIGSSKEVSIEGLKSGVYALRVNEHTRLFAIFN